jgi:hypothetical protein
MSAHPTIERMHKGVYAHIRMCATHSPGCIQHTLASHRRLMTIRTCVWSVYGNFRDSKGFLRKTFRPSHGKITHKRATRAYIHTRTHTNYVDTVSSPRSLQQTARLRSLVCRLEMRKHQEPAHPRIPAGQGQIPILAGQSLMSLVPYLQR